MIANEEKMNARISLPVERLEDTIRAKVNGVMPNHKTIVSPRDIKVYEEVCILKQDVVQAMIRNIPLQGDPTYLPYQEAVIKTAISEPRTFNIGQTFVSKQKLLDMMTALPKGISGEFSVSGFGSMPPVKIYGRDSQNQPVIALYVPPIIEYHNNVPALLDGIHRSFISRGSGSTINAIHISGASARLPFEPISWDECAPVDRKPQKSQRYKGLEMSLFRNLGAVGIDG